MLGEKVAEVFNGILEGGYHEFVFEARNLSSGVYFYMLKSGNKVMVKKMMLLK